MLNQKISKRKIIRRRNHLLFKVGSSQVCVHLRVLISDMGKVGIWMRIKNFKRGGQRLLIPMTRSEARIMGTILLEFGNRKGDVK